MEFETATDAAARELYHHLRRKMIWEGPAAMNEQAIREILEKVRSGEVWRPEDRAARAFQEGACFARSFY